MARNLPNEINVAFSPPTASSLAKRFSFVKIFFFEYFENISKIK
jgi:hypothetical protein